MDSKFLLLLLSPIMYSPDALAAEPNRDYAIVIHGGAGKPPATLDVREKRLAVLKQALDAGTGMLKTGKSSESVENAYVQILAD